MFHLKRKMLLYMLYLVFLDTVSTSRNTRRLDRLEDDVLKIRNDIIGDLKNELSDLRKDLKEERDLIRGDISTLFKMLSESSGQVDRHKIEEVSQAPQGSCNCGAIFSLYDNILNAFKREKSENVMVRKAFNEMRKQHDDFDSRLKGAEMKLRSDIHKNKNETNADITATQKLLHTIQSDTRAYCDDRVMHLNESLTNRSLNTLQEISRITSDIANLKTSNEILKNVSGELIWRCDGVALSGEYIINPYGMKVYCDVDSENKGWIVIQRRMDGSVDFNRSWADYKAGFGNLKGEFWLGNEIIYKLTKDKPKELRIDMEMFNGKKRYALYSKFNVSSESEKYQLYAEGYTGDAGDGIISGDHVGQSFSTFDADNDPLEVCCACRYGGWWYHYACFVVNLNGKYIKENETVPIHYGIHWHPITWYIYSLKFVQIKIH